ncbi:protein FAR1-related sequence 4 [Rhizophagus clarus]|uniref:Protein FAR1-related sequence 4 n=1 Tax=Rhizophagus clarus TaxID=94130 RepID=A0A8H3QJ63_9GLOM|nr:protein FAR1-related sequence 4 [Rhizophagus clarus]
MASSTSSDEQQQLHIGQYFVTWDTAIEYMGCKAHINLSRPEKDNINQYIYVTTISNDHCYELNCQLINYENKVMIIYLEEKYPEQKIRSDILHSEIQKYRPSAKDLSNDASKLYEYLIELKKNDTRWQIFVDFDEAKVLRRLFWMSPNQIELWIQYHDVIINDITYKTYKYNMALSLFVAIDNYNCGKRQNENINRGLIPLVFMTDSDPAVDATCVKVYKGFVNGSS